RHRNRRQSSFMAFPFSKARDASEQGATFAVGCRWHRSGKSRFWSTRRLPTALASPDCNERGLRHVPLEEGGSPKDYLNRMPLRRGLKRIAGFRIAPSIDRPQPTDLVLDHAQVDAQAMQIDRERARDPERAHGVLDLGQPWLQSSGRVGAAGEIMLEPC